MLRQNIALTITLSLIAVATTAHADRPEAAPKAFGDEPLRLVQADADNAAESETPPAERSLGDDPFAEGSTLWSLTVGGSRDRQIGEIYQTRITIDHYIDDDLAFRFGGTFAVPRVEDTGRSVYGGPDIGLRWHFFRHREISLFLDGTAGAVVHSQPLTDESLQFNFNLQGNVGGTYQLNDNLLLEAGVGWHHLSNARIQGKSRNLGYDAIIGFAGIMVPF